MVYSNSTHSRKGNKAGVSHSHMAAPQWEKKEVVPKKQISKSDHQVRICASMTHNGLLYRMWNGLSASACSLYQNVQTLVLQKSQWKTKPSAKLCWEMQYAWNVCNKSCKQKLLNAQTNQCGVNAIPSFYIPFFHRLVAGKSGQSGVTPGSLSRSWFTAEGKTDGL